jgi:tungstate transport system substrate-binding protein
MYSSRFIADFRDCQKEIVGTVRNLRTVVLGLILAFPIGIQAQDSLSRELRVIFPVTCVSPGLAKGLATLFETEYKIPVKIITLCTGDAIHFIKEHEGVEDVDAMIGHEPEAEEKFIKDGFAVNLRPVCFSDFVLVGPPDDPAKIKGLTNVLEALKKIADAKANFCSRADSSGTHGLEMRLWKMAAIKPEGDWYIRTMVGTESTLLIAAKKKGYFIAHWASFAQMAESKMVDLIPMVEDKDRLFTNYDILAMNPERFPKANYVTAMLFIGFLTSRDIQKYIAGFGSDKFGRPAFLPLAVKTYQPQKERKIGD